MFTRRKLLFLIPLALVSACTFQLMRETRGPNASTAYRWVFDESPPEFVSSLRSDYYSHLKGYGIHLGFTVPPDRLHEVLDTNSSKPLYHEAIDYLEVWRGEHKFREMFPENPPDVKACQQIQWSATGETWSIVYNPTTGNIYCSYLNDSDIN